MRMLWGEHAGVGVGVVVVEGAEGAEDHGG